MNKRAKTWALWLLLLAAVGGSAWVLTHPHPQSSIQMEQSISVLP